MKLRIRLWFGMAVGILLFTASAVVIPAQIERGEPSQAISQVLANEVVFDLVALDHRDRPISDLKPDQIAVTDNGNPVQITGMRLITGQQDEPLITFVFDRPALQSAKQTKSDFESNLSTAVEQDESKRIRDLTTNFLKLFPASGFQFAVVDIWGRLELQQQFTEDRNAVLQAVSSAIRPQQSGLKVAANAAETELARVAQTGQHASGTAVNAKERALARGMLTALQASSRAAKNPQANTWMDGLLALARAQQALPGRRAIVYFTRDGADSRGSPGYDNHAKQVLESLIGTANRAGISFYIVDLKRLDAAKRVGSLLDAYSALSVMAADPRLSAQSGAPRFTSPSPGEFGSNSAFRSINSLQETLHSGSAGLDELARHTGGKTINAAEGLSKAVKELIRDLTTYYEVVYLPPVGANDGSFHSTEVKALRKGLKIGTRSGYLASPRNAGLSEPPEAFELPLISILGREELPSDLEYRAAVLHMGHNDDGNSEIVALEVPLSALETREDTSTHLMSAHLSILANIRDGEGNLIEHMSEDRARRWAVGLAGAGPEFMSFERPFSAPAGSYVLETVILDQNSGKASAARQQFEIHAGTVLPELSQVILVRSLRPLQASETGSGLLENEAQFVEPNLDGKLPAGTQDISVFLVAHADPRSSAQATLNLEVLREGSSIGGMPLTMTLSPERELHALLSRLSVTSAADGQYEIKATLKQGEHSTESVGTFELKGGNSDASLSKDEAVMPNNPARFAAIDQAIARPKDAELDRILADARKNSLDYRDSLPNLICEQITNRAEDIHGDGNWKHKDTLVELLAYVNHVEERTPLLREEGGQSRRSNETRARGMSSAGEFGKSLAGIFKPESKAAFVWKESAAMRGEPVEVFEYRVERENSSFMLQAGSRFITVGYHGKIYVNRATRGVFSVTLVSDDAPTDFPIRKTGVRVDYDYVAINEHDYLLPVSAQVVTQRGKHTLDRNDLGFTNFRKFGSTVRIVDSEKGEVH